MLKLVVKKLKRHPLTRVKFLNAEQMEYYAQLIHEQEHAVDVVIGFINGVSLTSESTSEPVVQNSMYSGYHSDTMVNNLVGYGPDGRVIFCAINFLRSMHGGSITANISPYNQKMVDTYKMCVNQGLLRSGDADDVLVGPISHTQAYQLAPNLHPHLLCLSNIYVSLCQASEWGMRGLQGTFP